MGWECVHHQSQQVLERRSHVVLRLTNRGVAGSPTLDSSLQATTDPGRPRHSKTRDTVWLSLLLCSCGGFPGCL